MSMTLAAQESSTKMGHFLTGVIVKESDAGAVASQIPFSNYYPMQQGYVIFPLTDDLIDEKITPPQDFCFDEFTYLSNELSTILSGASLGKRIVYIETEYHGGQGCQAAIVFSNGEIIFGPKQSDIGPISEALKIIGVAKVPEHQDEFQSVGLGGFRSSEEILGNVQ